MSVAYRLTGTVTVLRTSCRRPGCAGTHRLPFADRRLADHRGDRQVWTSWSAAHRRRPASLAARTVFAGLGATDPLAAVVAAEDARFAAMVRCWSAAPRSAGRVRAATGSFVPLAGCGNQRGRRARQLASRAPQGRRRSRPDIGDRIRPTTKVVSRLIAAMAAGDLDTVVSLLHPRRDVYRRFSVKAPTAVRASRIRQSGPVPYSELVQR